jgi:quercetin dioxygenase-like cupin family protein
MGKFMTGVYLAQHDEHQQLQWLDGGVMQVVLDSAATNGQLTMLRTVLPKGAATPVHIHGAEDEIFLLLQGALTCWVGDDRYELREGGVAVLPRNLAHAYRVDSAEAHLLTLVTPGGLEGFFRMAGHDLATPAPEGWVLTHDAINTALIAHGGRNIAPPHGPDD